MHNAFYCRGEYFLVPEGYANAEAFLADLAGKAMPCTVRLVPLFEDNQEFIRRCKAWNGLSMVPYFISDYLPDPMEVTIEDAADIRPVTATLLTQKEYNARLRELVVRFCPGCVSYGGVTDKDSSLEGHHTEITLDGLCLYRRTADDPAFDLLDRLPSRWPVSLLTGSADDILAFLFKKLGLTYQSGLLRIHADGKRELLLRQSGEDVFLTGVTAILNAVLLREFGGRISLRLTNPAPTDDESLRALTVNRPDELRQAIQTHGLALGHADLDPGCAKTLLPFLLHAESLGFLTVLHTEDSRIWLLFADPAECLMYLRYHSPALETCHCRITVYGMNGPETRRLSFGMEAL